MLTEECEDEEKRENDDDNEYEAEVEGVGVVRTQIRGDLKAQDFLRFEQKEHRPSQNETEASLKYVFLLKSHCPKLAYFISILCSKYQNRRILL